MYCDNLQPWKQTRHLTSLHFVGHFIRIFWERDKFAQRDRGEGERTGWWEVRGYPGACEHQADTDTAHHQLSGQPTPPCACVSFCNINNTLPSLPPSPSLSSNLSSKNQKRGQPVGQCSVVMNLDLLNQIIKRGNISRQSTQGVFDTECQQGLLCSGLWTLDSGHWHYQSLTFRDFIAIQWLDNHMLYVSVYTVQCTRNTLPPFLTIVSVVETCLMFLNCIKGFCSRTFSVQNYHCSWTMLVWYHHFYYYYLSSILILLYESI